MTLKTLKTYGRGQQDFCVVYRKGGTDNFTWHRSMAMTKVDVNVTAAQMRRMGYHALVVNYAQSMSVGLPETYDYSSGGWTEGDRQRALMQPEDLDE